MPVNIFPNFGFRSQLLNFLCTSQSNWVKIIKAIDESNFASGIFADHQKAFDTVYHNMFCCCHTAYAHSNPKIPSEGYLATQKFFQQNSND